MRVEGRLAVTRAFGDTALKPLVTADPDVRCLDITDDCEFIIIASDGCGAVPIRATARLSTRCLCPHPAPAERST